MSKPSRTIQQTPEQIAALNDSLIDSELITPDRLYVDWSLLRDMQIGATVSLLMDDADQNRSRARFRYLQENIGLYIPRTFNDLAHYLPKLGLTSEQINNRLHDAAYATQIFHAAPVTGFLQVLYGNIQVNINHSTVKGKYKKIPVSPSDKEHYYKQYDPIRISINTYPLTLSTREHDLIAAFITGNFGVDVEILCASPKTLSVEFLLQMDEYYTNRIVDLLNNEAFSEALSSMKCTKKSIFAVKQLGDIRPPRINPRAVEVEFLRIQSTVDVLTKTFTWIPPHLLSYDIYPPETEKAR